MGQKKTMAKPKAKPKDNSKETPMNDRENFIKSCVRIVDIASNIETFERSASKSARTYARALRSLVLELVS